MEFEKCLPQKTETTSFDISRSYGCRNKDSNWLLLIIDLSGIMAVTCVSVIKITSDLNRTSFFPYRLSACYRFLAIYDGF